MIRFRQNSNPFGRTIDRLRSMGAKNHEPMLRRIGELGVKLLSERTPVLTGRTAGSWGYTVRSTRDGGTVTWHNSVMAGRTPLVVLIRYGYRTGTGGYVSGRNFITPTLRDVYRALSEDIAREVSLR